MRLIMRFLSMFLPWNYITFSNFTVDRVPPVILQHCNDVTATVGLNIGGIVVDWLEPSVSDNSGTVNLASRSHSPGQYFVVGSTEVSYRFADPSGNAATCTFDVIVIEGRPGAGRGMNIYKSITA